MIVTQIHFIQDLPNVQTLCNTLLLLELLIIGLVEYDSIGIAIFDEVEYFFADKHETLVPFSFDVIGALMVYGCEYLSGSKDSVH